jgi:hypothetical protein
MEKLKNRTADQDARRPELEQKLEEFNACDTLIEQAIVPGFPLDDPRNANDPCGKPPGSGAQPVARQYRVRARNR